MKIRFYFVFLTLLALIGITGCTTQPNDTGLISQSWQDAAIISTRSNDILTIQFNAKNSWKIRTETWCVADYTTGSAGEHTVRITTLPNTKNTSRSTDVKIYVDGYEASPAWFRLHQTGNGPITGDPAVNLQTDTYLKSSYLWNEEYKTLSTDPTVHYSDFLTNGLMSMQTNTLDKKMRDGEYHLFSYIRELFYLKSDTKSTPQVPKEPRYSTGILGITAARNAAREIVFHIRGVYKNSSAEQRGLTRGSILKKVNRIAITENNLYTLADMLLYPSGAGAITVTDDKNREYTIESTFTYPSPVVFTTTQIHSGHKVGYLVYTAFEAGYDDELFEAFKQFKTSGVTDIVIDLRYNGGGHIISGNLIGSCILGSTSIGKTYTSFRYNAERMQKYYNNQKEKFPFSYDFYNNLNTSLAAGGLNLNKVYFLISGDSFSSSEMLINGLRGVDAQVVLIGTRTGGKNVGMETIQLSAGEKTYELAPITFQSYNAKEESNFENGFVPDYLLNEDNPTGIGFIGYGDFGTDKDPLYAKAISLITGQPSPVSNGLRSAAAIQKSTVIGSFLAPARKGMILQRGTSPLSEQ